METETKGKEERSLLGPMWGGKRYYAKDEEAPEFTDEELGLKETEKENE